ncbi:MAG: PIN domain-containing protein [Armatimonadota bacterium]
MTSVLLDANILVYCYDARNQGRQQRALHLMAALRSRGRGAVSTQALAEFYSVVVRRLPQVSGREALARIAELASTFPVCDVTLLTVLEAARAAHQYRMSYWDAQLWATAKLNQIPTILTENMQGRESLEGVRFINPFEPAFDIAAFVG